MKQYNIKLLPVLSLIFPLFFLSGCQTIHSPNLVPSKPQESFSSSKVAEPEETLQCGISEDCFVKGRDAEKKGKRIEAHTYFKTILDRKESSPWSHRAGYLTSKWNIENKLPADMEVLEEIQKDYSEIKDYTEKLLADDAFLQGDFAKADELYSHILLIFHDTVLRPLILINKGESLYQLREYDQAAEMWTLFLKENPRDEKSAEILGRLVGLFSEKGDWDGAGKYFRELETKFPDTPWSVEEERRVSKLALSRPEREKFVLSNQEIFYQGRSLYEIGKFEKALENWKKFGHKISREEPFIPELELKMGLACLSLKRYSEATDHFKELIKKHPGSDFAPEALIGLARIAVREENESQLNLLRKEGERIFHRQEGYYKLLYIIGNYYEDHRQVSQAHGYFQKIITDQPQYSVLPDALWRDGWTYYKEGDSASAEKAFSKLVDQFPASPLQAQGLYWKGRANEKGEKWVEAQADFKRLCQNFSHSYYCHLAKKRANSVKDGSPLNQEPPLTISDLNAPPSYPFQKDDHYLKGRELMVMDLNQEAAREFNYLADHYRDKPSLLQLDKELIQAGDFYHALKILRGQFPDILDRGRSVEPLLIWELAYPKEVVEEIQRIVQGAKIEPEFVAGIMREESVFDARATSKSGAMGLMQLMPFTGEWVARQLGETAFVKEMLYNREVNTRYGAYYLDHLSEKFQGNLFYTAASYNAGPEAVSKWIMNGNFADLEEFVENIPYQETRYYVKRVIKSYEEFKEARSNSSEPHDTPLLDKFMLNR